jgi:DNA modification methylase
MDIELDKVYNMDCLSGLRQMPDNSVDCCITSPPYYGLRDYGVDGQIGLEKSPDDYVAKITEVFREVHRVLKLTGTLWLNIGDCYAGGNKGAAAYPDNSKKYKQGTNRGTVGDRTAYRYQTTCKDKDLIGIPWMLAFALRDKVGFYLRQDIIWHKPNPMPESVLDRCTKAHEYIFLFSKSSRYYFNHEEMQEQAVCAAVERRENPPRYGGNKYTATPDKFYRTKSGNAYAYTGKRNKRDVWTVSTKPDLNAHFAVYPEELIRPCVLAGCPVGGGDSRPFHGKRNNCPLRPKMGQTFYRIRDKPRVY